MFDPMSLFGIAGGALNLTSTLIKVHQEHARDPQRAPGLADIMRTIPGAAFAASERMIAAVEKLEQEIRGAGIDPGPTETLDDLMANTTKLWINKRYRVLDRFKANISAIAAEIETLFDDLVAISNCSESEALIARSYKQALERKQALRRDIDDQQPLFTILKHLRNHAQQLRSEIGDLDKK